uniref:Arrestin_N domain-containing protein n=1 Tax=Caenorhabditis tropicalis TaxID=1561998 RepID=A0A1I7UPH4_9PELO
MSLEIKLANSDGKYTCGDVISGDLVIENEFQIEVGSLKITLFTNSKFIVSKEYGVIKTNEWTQPAMIETLDSTLLDGAKSKVLEPGTHTIPFKFSSLPNDYSYSFEEDNLFCRYFLRARLEIKHRGSVTAKHDVQVSPLLLNDKPEANGWQTQTIEKHPKSSKKVELKVTLPKAIGRQEEVPIHFTTTAKSLDIRTRLIRSYRLPEDFDEQDMEYVESHSVEEFEDVSNGTHILKTNATRISHSGSLISEKYRIEVEACTLNSTLLMLTFPVMVGEWKDGKVDRSEFQ